MLGPFIKTYRIEQNMSQSALCQGICEVSYLSKIESNQVKPSHEIIVMLFDRLGANIPKDVETLDLYKEKMYEKK